MSSAVSIAPKNVDDDPENWVTKVAGNGKTFYYNKKVPISILIYLDG